MKLTAINRVQGVKVLAGKGKGTKNAFAGDVFEPKTAAEGERLINLGVAEEYKVHDPLAEAESKGTGTTKKAGGRKATGGKTAGKATQKNDSKAGGETGDQTKDDKTGDQKAEDGSDTASDDDLGLDD